MRRGENTWERREGRGGEGARREGRTEGERDRGDQEIRAARRREGGLIKQGIFSLSLSLSLFLFLSLNKT